MKRLPSCGNVIRTCSPISPYQWLKKLSTWIGFKVLVSEKLSSSKVLKRTPNYIQTRWTCLNNYSSIRRVKSGENYKKLWYHNSICHIWFRLQSRNAFSCTPFSVPTLARIKGNFVWTFFTLKLNLAGG